MKKITIITIMIMGLATGASAHHMSQTDTAGANIVEWSPHLLMSF